MGKYKKNIRNYHQTTMSTMHGIPNNKKRKTTKNQNTFFPPHTSITKHCFEIIPQSLHETRILCGYF